MGVESWYFRKIIFLNLLDLETLWYILESPSKCRLPPLHPTTVLEIQIARQRTNNNGVGPVGTTLEALCDHNIRHIKQR